LKYLVIASSFGLLLTSCTSPEEKCTNYGFAPGTDAFAACNMYVDEQNNSRKRRFAQSLGQGLGQISQSYYNQANSFAQQPQNNTYKSPYSTFRIGNKLWQCTTIGNDVTCK